MIFNDRLEFFDQCIAGERPQFDTIFSKKVFNTVDRSYELYRDYIKQKNTITNVSCDIQEDEIVIHLTSIKSMEDLVSNNLPKRGIASSKTGTGVDLHIKLIGITSL